MKIKSQAHAELVADQFVDLMQDFIRLRPPNLVMPEHIVRLNSKWKS